MVQKNTSKYCLNAKWLTWSATGFSLSWYIWHAKQTTAFVEQVAATCSPHSHAVEYCYCFWGFDLETFGRFEKEKKSTKMFFFCLRKDSEKKTKNSIGWCPALTHFTEAAWVALRLAELFTRFVHQCCWASHQLPLMVQNHMNRFKRHLALFLYACTCFFSKATAQEFSRSAQVVIYPSDNACVDKSNPDAVPASYWQCVLKSQLQPTYVYNLYLKFPLASIPPGKSDNGLTSEVHPH